MLGRTSVVDAATLTYEHILQMLPLTSLSLWSSLPWHPDVDAWSLCEVWCCLSCWNKQSCNSHPNFSVSSAVGTDRRLNFSEFSVQIHMKKQLLQRKTGISVGLLQEWEERVLLVRPRDLGSTPPRCGFQSPFLSGEVSLSEVTFRKIKVSLPRFQSNFKESSIVKLLQ